MADEPTAAPTTNSVTTTLTTTVCPDAHEKETILKGIITIALLCGFMLGGIAVFSLYLQTLTPPREPGSGVGACRENVMAIFSMAMGALIMAMKAKGLGQ